MSAQFQIRFEPGFAPLLQREVQRLERAATKAMRQSARDLQTAYRQQIVQAGLGGKLARTIRGEAYPRQDVSLRAAAVVWSKARDEIIAPHETGALVGSRDGFWLAVPILSAARMKGDRGRKITPLEYEQKRGVRLEMVLRPGKPPLLVDKGRSNTFAARRLRDGSTFFDPTPQRQRRRSRNQWRPVFVLLRQVRLRKRLNLATEARRVAGLVPSRFAAALNGGR